MALIVPGVHLLEGLRGCNMYLLDAEGELLLIDAGVPGQVEPFVDAVAAVGLDIRDLRTIVLTHAHPDHVGGATELAARTCSHVLAHRAEQPYLEEGRAMPGQSLPMRLLTWASRRLGVGMLSHDLDGLLEDGDFLDVDGELRVLHTPGHTPGSISLYHPARRLLFCGDLLFNANPLTGKRGLQYPMSFISVDDRQIRASVARIGELDIDILCPGHGPPITENAGEQVRALIAREGR